jgi:hypothetical protein
MEFCTERTGVTFPVNHVQMRKKMIYRSSEEEVIEQHMNNIKTEKPMRLMKVDNLLHLMLYIAHYRDLMN